MGRFRRGGPTIETDAQRRVRRSPLLFTVPIVLLVLLAAVLGWEAVRANMTEEARAAWPWRLQLLDMEPLGSLLAVAAGAVLARAQYARTVRPMLGWRADWTTGHLRGGVPEWQVGLLNGGSHAAVVEAYECRAVLRGEEPDQAAPWTDVQGVAAVLTGAGLTVGEDFQLVTMGKFPWWAPARTRRPCSAPSPGASSTRWRRSTSGSGSATSSGTATSGSSTP